MRQLPNHLPASAVLNEQRILSTDLVAPGDVDDFDEERCIVDVDWRDAAIDSAFVRMHFRGRKVHFIRVVIAGHRNATQDFSHFRLVVDELQQRLTACARTADTKNVFSGWIKVCNQQAVIEQDDA